MKHEHRFRKLGRTPRHRKDLLRTMLAQLIIHEQIFTTTAKAKEIAKRAEKVMALARRDTPAARDSAYNQVYQQGVVLPKIFGELRFRYNNRSKDFTRIWLSGYRQNDQGSKALIELVDSPIDTQSLFAIEFLPKLRRDLDFVRLKLAAAQKRKEPDAYQRHLLRKETMELETKERFFERLITRLEHALREKGQADESRVEWAKWELKQEVDAKTAIMEDLKTKLEVYGRLGGSFDDDKLRALLEGGRYDGAYRAKVSWEDWSLYQSAGEVKPSERTQKLLEEMVARQADGLRMIEEASVHEGVSRVTVDEAAAIREEEQKKQGEPKRREGSGLFGRLMGYVRPSDS